MPEEVFKETELPKILQECERTEEGFSDNGDKRNFGWRYTGMESSRWRPTTVETPEQNCRSVDGLATRESGLQVVSSCMYCTAEPRCGC